MAGIVETKKQKDTFQVIGKGVLIICIILLFLISIDMIGYSFQLLSGGTARSMLSVTANPFISLFIGLLVTAIIQSSSTTTSMVVALVGTGTLSLHHAIPIVMGANIGTTITSTLVSLGYITSKREFRKAISAGSIHDFYNIILTIILFPLEYNYRLLSSLSSKIAYWVSPPFLSDTQGVQHNVGILPFNPIRDFLAGMIDNNWVLLFLSFFILFAAIKILSKIIYSSLIGKSRDNLKKYVFKSPFSAFGWGALTTAAVQSSSLTTPLIVPLVATSKISLHNAFSYVIGANIGTTVTALIAAFFNSEAAVSIAVVHFLFNLTGVILFMLFPLFRNIPVRFALWFGLLTMRNRLYGFLYIVITFFILPFILIYYN